MKKRSGFVSNSSSSSFVLVGRKVEKVQDGIETVKTNDGLFAGTVLYECMGDKVKPAIIDLAELTGMDVNGLQLVVGVRFNTIHGDGIYKINPK